MKPFYLLGFIICCTCSSLCAQVNYTANQQVTPYAGKFRPGINMGYYPGWDNRSLADVAAGNPLLDIPGIGAKSNRVGLLEYVMDYFGYDLVVNDFEYWNGLGMGEYVAFIGSPTSAHRDSTHYCPGVPSNMFDNLYTPIWDGGANGTPYNDENYCAAYFYKVVDQYKDQVRFWEIWNEPGFDLTGNLGFRDQNYPGNWWLEGPNPCDNILQAPIYHYTRTLRIAWEVIKTLDPDSYVCLGSVGFPSFLNALLRNTDNPNGGDVSPDYPLGGGAYFDCLVIHSYPHFDGSTLNPDINLYERHSDQAADGVTKSRDDFQAVLDQYGYDGVTYPRKEWISTEINSPRKAFTGAFFAGEDAQINHMMKVQIVAKINGIRQLHPYTLFDQATEEEANNEFHLMGFYQNLDGQPAYSQVVNDVGKAMKTMSDLLFDTEYDPVRTAAMNLPPSVRGYAWKRPDGAYVYSLWARTTEDQSEAATAVYSLPQSFNASYCRRHEWDYGYTGMYQIVSRQNIQLTARPLFFTAGQGHPPCHLFATITDVRCDYNLTNNNLEDDFYTVKMTVGGNHTSGQWQAQVAGQTVAGALGSPVTLGPYIIADGNLHFVLQDAVNPACSTNVTVFPPGPCSVPVVYCHSQSNFPWHEWIAGVQFASLNQVSGKSEYSDYTMQSAMLNAGTNYPVGLTAGYSWQTFDEYWRIWIDFNQNGFFENGEIAYQGIQPAPPFATPSALFTGILTVPPFAIPGETRMRVSMKRDGFADPCEALQYGEVEDYSVFIVGIPGGPVPYCPSQSNFPWHDWIARVQVNDLDNSSGKTPYSDFMTLSTDLERGQPVDCAFTAGFSWQTFDEYWKVWIDYNQNGLFEEPSEIAFAGLLPQPAGGTSFAVLNGTLQAPLTALLGPTRMRVSMKPGSSPSPCEALPFGEVEDYMVNILPEQVNLQDRADNGHSLETEGIAANFYVYPNPAADKLTVDLAGYSGLEGALVLYNGRGQRMAEIFLTPETPRLLNLSLAAFPDGPYLLQLQLAGKKAGGRMIIINR